MNVRPNSAKKKIISPTVERKAETMNATTNVDARRYRNKFVNKLSNKSANRSQQQSTRTFKRVVDSNSNEQIYANEEDNTNPRSGNFRNVNTDRTGTAVSRSTAEEKNERTFTLRMT